MYHPAVYETQTARVVNTQHAPRRLSVRARTRINLPSQIEMRVQLPLPLFVRPYCSTSPSPLPSSSEPSVQPVFVGDGVPALAFGGRRRAHARQIPSRFPSFRSSLLCFRYNGICYESFHGAEG